MQQLGTTECPHFVRKIPIRGFRALLKKENRSRAPGTDADDDGSSRKCLSLNTGESGDQDSTGTIDTRIR